MLEKIKFKDLGTGRESRSHGISPLKTKRVLLGRSFKNVKNANRVMEDI